MTNKENEKLDSRLHENDTFSSQLETNNQKLETESQPLTINHQPSTKISIAIIGGGLTGLVAAYRLSKQGHKVTIYERNSDIGGLASDFQMQGTSLEKTYHHIFKSDLDIINLVKELGLEDKLMWCKSSMAVYYEGNLYAYGTPKSLLLFKPLSIIDRVRQAFVLLYLAKTNSWKKFTKVSAYSWLKKWAGKNNMKVIFEPLLKGKFDKFYDKVSMGWMWARVHVRGNSQEKGGEKLGYFNGGFHIIIKELEKRLKENGVEIVLNAKVEAISGGDSLKDLKEGESSREMAFVKVNGANLEFDRVIATVPSHVFGNLIQANFEINDQVSRGSNLQDYINKLNSVEYLGAVVAVFSSEQSLSKYYWHNINDISMPFLAFIQHTNLVDKSHYNNKNVYYIGSYVPNDHKYFSMTDEEVYDLWFQSVKKIFPDFDETKVIDKYLFKLKNGQHIVDLDYESKIPDYKTPIPGVYLSNFSQIYPEDRGTNYAVREGNKIAKLITNK
jgi:protoporphyrinogen oxidase